METKKLAAMFKLTKRDKKSNRRTGEIETRRGVVKTPVFMPIATRGAVKNLTPEELRSLGAEIILANTYHLWLRPGSQVIKKSGGLHKFMNWGGPILTDSGGFQVFSLAKHRKITEEGIEFNDPDSGKRYFLTPEKSIQIQLDLGADIIMALDECTAYPCGYDYAKKSAELTLRWAQRCKRYFDGKISPNPSFPKRGVPPFEKGRVGGICRPLLFGIVQGSVYKDLRVHSAEELVEIGFDGYAIGSVANGREPRKYIWKVLDWVLPLLPYDRPRYMMGLGRPEEIVKMVGRGIDMFDCVIPTREARHGRIYKFKVKSEKLKVLGQKSKFYETLQITNSKFAKDTRALDEHCACQTCQNYSRAYLNHLFKIKENLGLRLATIHNLKFYLDLMESLKK